MSRTKWDDDILVEDDEINVEELDIDEDELYLMEMEDGDIDEEDVLSAFSDEDDGESYYDSYEEDDYE